MVELTPCLYFSTCLPSYFPSSKICRMWVMPNSQVQLMAASWLVVQCTHQPPFFPFHKQPMKRHLIKTLSVLLIFSLITFLSDAGCVKFCLVQASWLYTLPLPFRPPFLPTNQQAPLNDQNHQDAKY